MMAGAPTLGVFKIENEAQPEEEVPEPLKDPSGLFVEPAKEEQPVPTREPKKSPRPKRKGNKGRAA